MSSGVRRIPFEMSMRRLKPSFLISAARSDRRGCMVGSPSSQWWGRDEREDFMDQWGGFFPHLALSR